MSATVTVRWIEQGVLLSGGLPELAKARAAGDVWIDVLAPDEATIASLAETFGIHPLTAEDFLHFPQRPKADPFPDGLFLVWAVPRLVVGDGIEYDEIDVYLTKACLITSHLGPVAPLDRLLEDAAAALSRGSEWTLHALLDRAVDEVFPLLDYITDRLDTIEDAMLERADREQLRDLYAMKRLLIALHKTIGPERDVVRAMARQTDLISQEAYLYFQDVGDHLARVADSVDTYRDVASGAMDIYLSSVSNRMNEIMKQLTVVATIFMPLTLMTGVYGMNVTVGMWPSVGASWSFAAVICSMLLIAAGMLWLFKKRGWW